MRAASNQEAPVSRTGIAEIPSGGPTEWSVCAVDGVIAWEFLIDDGVNESDGRRRPWLVVSEQPGPFGAQRLAVPRLVPQCEWQDDEARQTWHEQAWRGEAVPVVAVETVLDAREATPVRLGRRANAPAILPERLAVTVECDLRDAHLPSLAIVSALRSTDEQSSLRRVSRYRQEGRKLLFELGGLPWAAFPTGKLPARWWEASEFAGALDRWRWHAFELWYRDKWEPPRHALSRAQETVYLLLRLQDAQSLSPESRAVARATLEADVRESDALSIDQWVARLESAARPGCVDPHQLLHDFPVLREAWTSVRSTRSAGVSA
jgi:hypothetical protein